PPAPAPFPTRRSSDLCMLLALGTLPAAADASVAVGVNVVYPQRLSAAAREAALDQLQAAGVHMIRAPLAPPWGGDDYGPAIDFIDRKSTRLNSSHVAI